jgi:cytochrome P450
LKFLTIISACWILLYISFYAHWKSAIYSEVHALLAQYTNSSDPLHKRLSAIPISVWEDEMPTLDLVLRETLRLVVNGTALRRSLPGGGGENLKMPGVGEVPSGGFLAYSVSDAHMNPSIYTDPGMFDPERFTPGREEDKREPYSFLGWGAGE